MAINALKGLALLVSASVLATGSAYAGATVAENSVGSRQVIDGSLRPKDLAAGTAPRTYTVVRAVPAGTTTVLKVPGLAHFDVSCSANDVGLFVGIGDDTPSDTDPTSQHNITGSDISDNNPSGTATITSWGGGVGFSTNAGSPPSSGSIVLGDYWGRTDTLLAHGRFSWGHPSPPCQVRLQVVVQRLSKPDPLPRLRVPAYEKGCDASGRAYCLEP